MLKRMFPDRFQQLSGAGGLKNQREVTTVSKNSRRQVGSSHGRLESQIEEDGRTAMKEAPKQAIQQHKAQQTSCPWCGSHQCHSQGTKRRILLTRFVPMALSRRKCRSAC